MRRSWSCGEVISILYLLTGVLVEGLPNPNSWMVKTPTFAKSLDPEYVSSSEHAKYLIEEISNAESSNDLDQLPLATMRYLNRLIQDLYRMWEDGLLDEESLEKAKNLGKFMAEANGKAKIMILAHHEAKIKANTVEFQPEDKDDERFFEEVHQLLHISTLGKVNEVRKVDEVRKSSRLVNKPLKRKTATDYQSEDEDDERFFKEVHQLLHISMVEEVNEVKKVGEVRKSSRLINKPLKLKTATVYQSKVHPTTPLQEVNVDKSAAEAVLAAAEAALAAEYAADDAREAKGERAHQRVWERKCRKENATAEAAAEAVRAAKVTKALVAEVHPTMHL